MAKSTTENPAEREQAPEPAQVRKAPADDATHVKYVGRAHVREISAADWKKAGVDDQGKVSWDRRNPAKNLLPVSELSSDALDYLRTDDGFEFVKGK